MPFVRPQGQKQVKFMIVQRKSRCSFFSVQSGKDFSISWTESIDSLFVLSAGGPVYGPRFYLLFLIHV